MKETIFVFKVSNKTTFEIQQQVHCAYASSLSVCDIERVIKSMSGQEKYPIFKIHWKPTMEDVTILFEENS